MVYDEMNRPMRRARKYCGGGDIREGVDVSGGRY